jgi:hypothetical protein
MGLALNLKDMVAGITAGEKEAVLIRKIASKCNFHLLFLAGWTSGLFNFMIVLDLELGQPATRFI